MIHSMLLFAQGMEQVWFVGGEGLCQTMGAAAGCEEVQPRQEWGFDAYIFVGGNGVRADTGRWLIFND